MRAKLVKVNPKKLKEVKSILGPRAIWLSNGVAVGDIVPPDGNACLYDAMYISRDQIQALIDAKLATVVEGHMSIYPAAYWGIAPNNAREWSGYRADKLVFWIE